MRNIMKRSTISYKTGISSEDPFVDQAKYLIPSLSVMDMPPDIAIELDEYQDALDTGCDYELSVEARYYVDLLD